MTTQNEWKKRFSQQKRHKDAGRGRLTNFSCKA